MLTSNSNGGNASSWAWRECRELEMIHVTRNRGKAMVYLRSSEISCPNRSQALLTLRSAREDIPNDEAIFPHYFVSASGRAAPHDPYFYPHPQSLTSTKYHTSLASSIVGQAPLF